MSNKRFQFFTLIVCVLLISSCTIQKRLYQPGWDITFRGSLKKPNISSHETVSTQTTDEIIVEKLPEKVIEQSDNNDAVEIDITNKEKEQSIKGIVQLNQFQESLAGELSQFKKITFFKSKPKENDSKSTRTASIVGLILISIGAFLFVIGLLFFLSTNASIFYSIFSIIIGLIFMYIGGLMILITLLVLLIMFITRAIIKNEKRIKEQSQTTEKTPANQPNLEIEKSDVKNETPIEVTPEPTKKTENNTKGLITLGAVVAAFTLIYLLIKQ